MIEFNAVSSTPFAIAQALPRQLLDIEKTPMFVRIAEGLENRSILHYELQIHACTIIRPRVMS